MTLLSYFLVAFLLSAVGTIPIGIITLTIMQRTLEAGKKAGMAVAFGATIPEFFYTFIALFGLDFLNNEAIQQHIKTVAVFIFFALAIYYFFKKTKPITLDKHKGNRRDMGRGFLAGMMNMLIIPFWILVGIWLQSYDYQLNTHTQLITFSIGAALGALFIFWLYVLLGSYILRRIGSFIQYTNRVIACFFLALGVYQLVQLLV